MFRRINKIIMNTHRHFLDNARSIIHQNIEAVASSASSIIVLNGEKRKANKTSENPFEEWWDPKEILDE